MALRRFLITIDRVVIIYAIPEEPIESGCPSLQLEAAARSRVRARTVESVRGSHEEANAGAA